MAAQPRLYPRLSITTKDFAKIFAPRRLHRLKRPGSSLVSLLDFAFDFDFLSSSPLCHCCCFRRRRHSLFPSNIIYILHCVPEPHTFLPPKPPTPPRCYTSVVCSTFQSFHRVITLSPCIGPVDTVSALHHVARANTTRDKRSPRLSQRDCPPTIFACRRGRAIDIVPSNVG